MTENRKITTPWAIVLGVLGLLGIFAIQFAVESYLNAKVRERVNDPEFIRKVAAQVRPSVIFDGNGTILADIGAMQFLEKIEVAGLYAGAGVQQIVVYPKEHLAYPPLLQSVDSATWEIRAKRGKAYQWVYELSLNSTADNQKEFRFRLEIIR